jgi:hypothetical protein
LRCGRCGNENAEGFRFCGMCGAPLTGNANNAPAPQAGSTQPRGSFNPSSVSTPSGGASATLSSPSLSASKSTSPSQPTATQPANPVAVQPEGRWAAASSAKAGSAPSTRTEPASTRERWNDDGESAPVISGPSFLGLNQPGPRRSESEFDEDGSRALDRLRASRSVDYLLEDDEPPRRAWGKVILILVALALACAFGYLRWKQGGFDWLTAVGEKKPTSAQTAPDVAGSADSGSPAGTATSAPAPTATAAPTTSTAAGATTTGTAPAAGAAATTPSDTSSSPANSPQSTTQTPAIPETQVLQNSSATADSSKAASGTQAENGTQNSVATPDDKSSDADGSNEEQPAETKPAPSKPAVVKRALPKASPARPVDNVAEAQRYIYGRGAAQDCDRGLAMLKTAAGQSDAQAMILLGSLYSSGTCAPRDLPTAYRWYAVALHKQPENQALQNDLQKLWSQMTQPERQLAIRLSQ